MLAVLVTIVLAATTLRAGDSSGEPTSDPREPSPVPDARWGTPFVGNLGGAAIVDNTVVVYTVADRGDESGEVVGYDIDGGQERWRHPASFFAIAGNITGGATARVVAGHVGERGFDVLDPNGTLIWSESSSDVVWTYENIIISLSCADPSVMSACELTGYPLDPRSQSTQPGWRTFFDGVEVYRFSLGRGNPRLDTELAAHSSADQGSGGGVYLGHPVIHDWATSLFALPLIGGSTAIVSVTEGRTLRIIPDESATVTYVTADRVLHLKMSAAGAGCRGALRAENGSGTEVLWQSDPAYEFRPPIDQWGCQRPIAPLQGGVTGVLASLNGTQPVLLSVEDGRPYWVGADGVRVLATDGKKAVVNGPDDSSVRVVDTDQQEVTGPIAIPDTVRGAVVAGSVPILRGRQWWALDLFDEPRDLGTEGDPIFASSRLGLVVGAQHHVWFVHPVGTQGQ